MSEESKVKKKKKLWTNGINSFIGNYIIPSVIDNQQRKKQNFRIKLGLGYEEAKFNYL